MKRIFLSTFLCVFLGSALLSTAPTKEDMDNARSVQASTLFVQQLAEHSPLEAFTYGAGVAKAHDRMLRTQSIKRFASFLLNFNRTYSELVALKQSMYVLNMLDKEWQDSFLRRVKNFDKFLRSFEQEHRATLSVDEIFIVRNLMALNNIFTTIIFPKETNVVELIKEYADKAKKWVQDHKAISAVVTAVTLFGGYKLYRRSKERKTAKSSSGNGGMPDDNGGAPDRPKFKYAIVNVPRARQSAADCAYGTMDSLDFLHKDDYVGIKEKSRYDNRLEVWRKKIREFRVDKLEREYSSYVVRGSLPDLLAQDIFNKQLDKKAKEAALKRHRKIMEKNIDPIMKQIGYAYREKIFLKTKEQGTVINHTNFTQWYDRHNPAGIERKEFAHHDAYCQFVEENQEALKASGLELTKVRRREYVNISDPHQTVARSQLNDWWQKPDENGITNAQKFLFEKWVRTYVDGPGQYHVHPDGTSFSTAGAQMGTRTASMVREHRKEILTNGFSAWLESNDNREQLINVVRSDFLSSDEIEHVLFPDLGIEKRNFTIIGGPDQLTIPPESKVPAVVLDVNKKIAEKAAAFKKGIDQYIALNLGGGHWIAVEVTHKDGKPAAEVSDSLGGDKSADTRVQAVLKLFTDYAYTPAYITEQFDNKIHSFKTMLENVEVPLERRKKAVWIRLANLIIIALRGYRKRVEEDLRTYFLQDENAASFLQDPDFAEYKEELDKLYTKARSDLAKPGELTQIIITDPDYSDEDVYESITLEVNLDQLETLDQFIKFLKSNEAFMQLVKQDYAQAFSPPNPHRVMPIKRTE